MIERAYKHIVGFTLRTNQLFFNDEPLTKISESDLEMARDVKVARQKSDRIVKEGKKSSSEHQSDRLGSICATYRKAEFASKNWDCLREATPEMIFQRLTFGYKKRVALPTALDAPSRSRMIKQIEKPMIQHFNPICNTDESDGSGNERGHIEDICRTLKEILNTIPSE